MCESEVPLLSGHRLCDEEVDEELSLLLVEVAQNLRRLLLLLGLQQYLPEHKRWMKRIECVREGEIPWEPKFGRNQSERRTRRHLPRVSADAPFASLSLSTSLRNAMM